MLSLDEPTSGIVDSANNPLAAVAPESWSRVNPTVTLSANRNSLPETGGSAVISATLSETTDVNVTVILQFSGPATLSADYSRSLAQIVIPAGSTIGSMTVNAIPDGQLESTESIIIDIDSIANGQESDTQQVTLQINDDDHAPVFTTTATPSVAEGTEFIMSVIATDADVPSQLIIYTITGVLDAALFALTQSGDLNFQSVPDFESPLDADGDNVYEVQITANDRHGGTVTQDLAVAITDVDEGPKLNLVGQDVTWVKRQPAATLLPQVVVGGAAQLAGGLLTIDVNVIRTLKKSLDLFVFPTVPSWGSTAGPQSANGHLTMQVHLEAGATNSVIQSFLRGVTFATKGKGLKTLTRSMTVTLQDTNGLSARLQQTVHVRKKA